MIPGTSPKLGAKNEAKTAPLPVLVERVVLIQGPQAHFCSICGHDLPLKLLQVEFHLVYGRVTRLR